MRDYHIYKLADGLFTGQTVTCSSEQMDVNVPDGMSAIQGKIDYLAQRVDLTTGRVVDYQPPQPSVNHVWDADTKRWLYVDTPADLARKARETRDRIIRDSDWLVIREQEAKTPVPAEWSQYRQALRDITKQKGFPQTVVWPQSPSTAIDT